MPRKELPWAPGVNIYRSPLCGRNFEYLGEDPCLSASMVSPYIRGCQDQGVATTVKHYAGNFQEYNRHHISTDADQRTLREVYLPAFQAAVRDGGSACLMTAYNLVNGQHASEHEWLIQEILKGEWGFAGLVMSDWVSVYSAIMPANNGLDLEMPSAEYLNREKLLPAIANGTVDPRAIDDKVRRLLRVAACFGWLDHPQQDESIPMDDPDTAAVALAAARESCVLLRNEDLLPLEPADGGTIAVIGAHATEPVICGGGSAYTPPNHTVSILDSLRELADADVTIEYARGANPWRMQAAYENSPFAAPTGEPGLLGEYFNGPATDEPVVSRVDPVIDFGLGTRKPAEGIEVPGYTIRWTGELRPTEAGTWVVYLDTEESCYRLQIGDEVLVDAMDGGCGGLKRYEIELPGTPQPVVLEYHARRAWNRIRLGVEPASAIAAEREEAAALAARADAVVLAAGFTRETEGEGWDRTFTLPPDQEALIRAVAAANPRTVLVLHAGGNVDMDGWIDDLGALLMAWYPGQEGGRAVAEILLGRVNPSGRLPATFEHRLEDRSSFACYHDSNGDLRVALEDGVFTGYRHHDRSGVAPRFAFGFGLSYTTFAYENIEVPATFGPDDSVDVRFDVVNTGDRAGAEVAQVYVDDVEASVPRPAKELKGFARVRLEPGERRTITVTLAPPAFRFFDPVDGWRAEPGDFRILIAAAADDIRLEATVTLEA